MIKREIRGRFTYFSIFNPHFHSKACLAACSFVMRLGGGNTTLWPLAFCLDRKSYAGV